MPSKKIFVTGVNGHVGNNIVRDLLEHGYHVIGTVRDLDDPSKVDHVRQHAIELNCEAQLELIQADVLDADGWTEAITGCDALFHTATVYSNSDKADIIIAFFGYNESFQGAAGLANYKAELDAFIKHTLSQQYNGNAAPQLALVSPIAFEIGWEKRPKRCL